MGQRGMAGPRIERETLLAALFTALFMVLVGVATSRHEMWRDEMQAWLLARDSANPLVLLHNIRYEGHPGLWHLLLWPLTRFTSNPVWMQALHVLIAGGSAFLLSRYSPFPWPVKILMPLGYYFSYEWGVIARNYAISVLLIFGFCALFQERWRRFPLLGALVFLISHTNIHALLIALVLLVWVAAEYLIAFAQKRDGVESYRGRFLAGLVIALFGIASGIVQMKPPADGAYAPNWNFKPDAGAIRDGSAAMINAYLPVPGVGVRYWNANRFRQPPAAGENRPWLPAEAYLPFAITTLALGSFYFIKRPWVIPPYLAGSSALLLFFCVKFLGHWRHHGMLYLLFVALLWISFYVTPWKVRRPGVERLASFWDRHRISVLVPLLAIHVWGAWQGASLDWKQPFTQASAAARWLVNRFPDRTGVFFVGYGSEKAVPVVGAMRLDRCYYPDREEFGSYVLWDRRRMEKVYYVFLSRVARVAAREGKDAVLVLSLPLPAYGWGMGVTELARFDGPAATDENYFLYFWGREKSLPWAAGTGTQGAAAIREP